MFLYKLTNKITGNCYYGITVNISRRMASHRHGAASGVKSKFYDAVRSYGWEQFELSILLEETAPVVRAAEIAAIAADPNCYNLHLGGTIGFDVTTKPESEVEEWKSKLRLKRKGRQPALGMKHTPATKILCGEYGKLRWDIYGRYPAEVLDCGFAEANRKYGISKTHYYRLRKAAAEVANSCE